MQYTTNNIRNAMEFGVSFSATVAPTMSGSGWIVMLKKDLGNAGVWTRQRGGDREFKTLDAACNALTGELGIQRFEVSVG